MRVYLIFGGPGSNKQMRQFTRIALIHSQSLRDHLKCTGTKGRE